MNINYLQEHTMCRKLAGTKVGKLCDRCAGKCIICESFVNPFKLVKICFECELNYCKEEDVCLICNYPGNTPAYYCRECCRLEKDRDGCPKIVDISIAKINQIFQADTKK